MNVTINQSFFPDLGAELGSLGQVQRLLVLSVDCTKAFAAHPDEIPADARNLRHDGLPPLHIGLDNLRLMGDNLKTWYRAFKELSIPIIATADNHNWNDPIQRAERAVYGPHADEDSYEAELIRDVEPYVDYYVAKRTYDSFHDTDLLDQLQNLHQGLHPLQVGVIVTGFVTHVCVASALLRLSPLGYRAVAPSFLMGDFNRIYHNTFVHNVFPTWGNIVIKRQEDLCSMLGITMADLESIRRAA